MNEQHAVTIGHGLIFEPPAAAFANLGSCLGIAVGWPQRSRFCLAHCLLPERREVALGHAEYRYVAETPELLLRRLKVPQSRYSELRIVLAGGAEMYDGSRAGVGAKNVSMGLKVFKALGIRVFGRDVNGRAARRIRLDANTGVVTVTQLDADAGHEERSWNLVR